MDSSINQNHPQEKEMQKGKMVVWGGHTIAGFG